MDLIKIENDSRRKNKIHVDADRCMGCMTCVRNCIYDIYKWDAEERLPVVTYPEECTSCLQCMYWCPSGAVKVEVGTVAVFDPLYDPLDLNAY